MITSMISKIVKLYKSNFMYYINNSLKITLIISIFIGLIFLFCYLSKNNYIWAVVIALITIFSYSIFYYLYKDSLVIHANK